MYTTYKPYLQTIIMWALRILLHRYYIGSDCASCRGKFILVISPEKYYVSARKKKWFFSAFIIYFWFFFLRYLEYNTREYSIINSQLYGTMGKTDLSCAYNNIWRVVYNNMYTTTTTTIGNGLFWSDRTPRGVAW